MQFSQIKKERINGMDEQESKILELMKDKDYVPMKAKEIAMVMRVPKVEYQEFLGVLRKLGIKIKNTKKS